MLFFVARSSKNPVTVFISLQQILLTGRVANGLVTFIVSLILLYSSSTDIRAQVVINEVQASNNFTIADEDGDYEDWIELYNAGEDTVRLNGYGLSDDYGDYYRWVFPDGTYIAPDDYLLIWASGKDRRDPDAPLHTNFSIRSEGEEVLLSSYTIPDPDNSNTPVIDELKPTPIPSDYSFGRYPDGTDNRMLFSEPTPGKPNKESGYEGLTEEPSFSRQSGFYREKFDLELTADDPGAVIYYTTDGSEPDTGSTVYEEQILIDRREQDENVFSTIRTSYHHSWASPAEPVFKGHVIRAIAVKEGFRESEVVTGSWFVDPQGPDRYGFPVISIATDSLHLFDYETGIFVPGTHYEDGASGPTGNYAQRGFEWERPGHLTFLENGEPGKGFTQNVGLRVHGGWTRRYPQKSIRVYARSNYDWDPEISYPLFPGHTRPGTDDPLKVYKRLILRSSGDDWFHTMFKDAMVQSLTDDRELDQQAYRPSVVFINGEYWGIHNIRERYDGWYVQNNYGIHRDDVVVLVGNAEVNHGIKGDGLTEGDDRHYRDMRNYARDRDLSKQEHYDHIKTRMDVDNYLDYITLQVYAANADWPHNNIRYWRKRTDEYRPDAPYGADGRWRWMVFDMDATFGYPYGGDNAWWAEYDHDMIEWITGTGNPRRVDEEWVNQLFNGLIENETFRNRFISQLTGDLNTRYNPDHVVDRIQSFKKRYHPEIQEHMDRHRSSAGSTLNGWKAHVETMKEFARKRPEYLRKHIKNHFDIPGKLELVAAVNDENKGFVRIDSIDIHPDTPGVSDNDSDWSGTYFEKVPVKLTAVPEKDHQFVKWLDQEGNPIDFDELSTKDSPDPYTKTWHWIPEEDLKVIAVFEPKDSGIGENGDEKPETFQLGQNYPNPFNNKTHIPYELAEQTAVIFDIHTIEGRLVKRIDKGVKNAGSHVLQVDAGHMASGVYLYRMRVVQEDYGQITVPSRKMLLIR